MVHVGAGKHERGKSQGTYAAGNRFFEPRRANACKVDGQSHGNIQSTGRHQRQFDTHRGHQPEAGQKAADNAADCVIKIKVPNGALDMRIIPHLLVVNVCEYGKTRPQSKCGWKNQDGGHCRLQNQV